MTASANALGALGLASSIALAVALAGCGDDALGAADAVAADVVAPDGHADAGLDDVSGADAGPDDAAGSDAADAAADTAPAPTCPGGCDDGASCVDGVCRCDEGFTGDGDACVDRNECTEGTAICGAGASCINLPGSWTCTCPDGSEGQALSCDPGDCGCPWDSTGCRVRTAALEVVVLDLWARPLAGAGLTVTSDAGDAVPFDASGLAPLCGSDVFSLSAAASHHHTVDQLLTWYSPTTPEGLVSTGATPFGGATAITRAPRVVDGAELPVYTVWVGLPHRWFAASAPPWHPNTPVELLTQGESAWAKVAEDIDAATDLVTLTSWWWRSDFELVRPGPAASASLSAAQRHANTVMARLDASPAQKKVLITQFISQDGLFSNLNVDSALLARGDAANDGFDFMGHANTAAGAFTVTPPAPDFGAALAAAHPAVASSTWVHERPAEAFNGPIDVDMSDLPLGLGLFDVAIASWHQKLVTIDQEVAFVGGMNLDYSDWDSGERAVFDPRRMPPSASASARQDVLAKRELPEYAPNTDFMARFTGPAVRDVVAVFHRRWEHQLAAGVRFADKNTPFTLAPPTPAPTLGGVALQVVATMPAPFDEYGILETLTRAIGQAERYIYIQDQYFRAPILADAIIDRMHEVPDLQLIVVTNPVGEWTDPGCWQTYLQNAALSEFADRYSVFKLQSFDYVRTDCVFCFDETEAHFVEHYMHAKLVIIDDTYLQVGSANHNNRGLTYEGELAVAIFDPTWVEAQRHRIVGGLLGPAYAPSTPASDLLASFRAAAGVNQAAYDAWDDEWMDLDLDGAPVPPQYLPSGLVYPLALRAPNKCFIEGVGPDVM